MKKEITEEMLVASQQDKAFQHRIAQDEFWFRVSEWALAPGGAAAKSLAADRVEALIYSWIKKEEEPK